MDNSGTLVDRQGNPKQVGDDVTSFRGEGASVVGWKLGTHPGSTGRIYVTFYNSDEVRSYYPSVFDCRIK